MKRLSVLLLAAAFLVLLGLGCACAEEQVSGDYVYRINDSGEIVFLSGPTAENGTMLVIPQKIDGKKVTEFSFEQIPEEVTYILAPFNCYCFDQKGLTHDVLVFACQDYETCHSYENLTYDAEAVLPGEYLLLNVYGYMPEKYVFEYNVQKDYYEYPASIDGKKAALQKKRDVIDLVFENGYKAMCALSPEKRAEICTKLLQKEAEGGETVVPAAADRELIEKAVASLKSVNLTVSPEDAGIDNGFLLKGNGYEKDCSFRSILTLLRDLEETEVAKLLFN